MPSISSSLPERAWQMVLDQLRTDMPLGSYNTWVKPVRFVSFEDGIFTLEADSPKAREWLQDRMTMLVQRQLQGILNQPIAVRFVVADPKNDRECEEKEPQRNSKEDDSQDRGILLEVLHESVRSVLIEPERVVKLPVYFLRWLPYVDAQVVFLVLALRQEYYLATSGRKHAAGKVAVRAEQICHWAGISRAQFFRLLQPGSEFGWFGKKSETDYEVDRYTGRTKKSPNKYTLYGVPITPGDAEDLKRYLLDHGIARDPEDSLRNALIAQPREVFQYPGRKEGFEKRLSLSKRLTVQDVVREVLGPKLTPEIVGLIDQLSDHLLMPNEFILISWYFLRHWLSRLGADASMLVFMLRNACYFNDATGGLRDEVWIENGYQALAKRLGLDNPRKIAYWFPSEIEHGRRKEILTTRSKNEVYRRVQLQDWLGAFVGRLDHRAGSNGAYSWKFKVQRRDPLIPEHDLIYRRVAKLIIEAEEGDCLSDLLAWVRNASNDCFETHETQTKVVLRRSNYLDGCPETVKTRINDCLETLKIDGDDCFETLLKILKSFKDSYREQDTSTNQDSSLVLHKQQIRKVVADVTDAENEWSLEKLLERAGAKQRCVLLEQERDAIPFVSWIIQGATNGRIQSPYSLAIARLVETPRIGAGGAYDRLAALAPEQFVEYLRQRLTLCQPSDRDWVTALGKASLDRVRMLADLLSIPVDLLEEENHQSNFG